MMSYLKPFFNQLSYKTIQRWPSLPSSTQPIVYYENHTLSAPTSRPKLVVVCLIDVTIPSATLSQRKRALEDIKKACHSCNASLHHIQFQKLNFEKINVNDTFYNADVAIVDLSIKEQQNSLFYRIGNRECLGMKHNIFLFNDSTANDVIPISPLTSKYNIITYRLSDDKRCYITEPSAERLVANFGDFNFQNPSSSETKNLLLFCLRNLLLDVEFQPKTYLNEKFLADLRLAQESLTGEELTICLRNMRKRLEHDLDHNLVSTDVIHELLMAFREIQEYDAMVEIIDNFNSLPNTTFTFTPAIRHLYAFSLVQRKYSGDREKALNFINNALEKEENCIPDMFCLAGKIYKELYIESLHEDKESLHEDKESLHEDKESLHKGKESFENALKWYRKGFEVEPNAFAGINLATLLVLKGEDFSKCSELQHITSILYILIGGIGNLTSIKNYWDVATFFEMSVLTNNYSDAIQAAECMFNLKPLRWYLKSTVSNIKLIYQSKRQLKVALITPEEQIFKFWMEYFIDANKDDISTLIRFPMLVLETKKILMPSYVTVNLNDTDGKSLQINNICLRCLCKEECKRPHKWLFSASNIRGISLYNADQRCLFLYVHQNSEEFQMFFASEEQRKRFYDLTLKLTADEEVITDFTSIMDNEPIEFEYELDEQNRRVKLGKGTYGEVFAAIDLRNQISIAIKEITIINIGYIVLNAIIFQNYI